MTIRTAFAASAVWLAAAGCVQNPATGRIRPRLITTAEEIAIGRQAAPEFEAEWGGKIANKSLQQYVRWVGARLAAVSERRDVPYEYALLASDVPNAFALPGGKIYITAGLMERLTNERQLAAVLGHETGHVAAEHNVYAIQRQMGATILADLASAAVGGKGGEVVKVATDVAGAMLGLRYSRQDEYEADLLGVRYMNTAGYNPWGMVELLDTLQREAGPEPESGPLGQMFQTHPLTRERIEEAREEIRRRYRRASPTTADPNAGRFRRMQGLLRQALGTRR